MVVEPASAAKVALKLAPKAVPLGKRAIGVLLGLNDMHRLFALVERDVRASGLIPAGGHGAVWKQIEGQRADPDVAGAVSQLLTRGDIALARERLGVRLGQLLRFGDPAIDDAAVARLVAGSIERNLAGAPLKDRDAMRVELALARAAIEELGEQLGSTRGAARALEAAVVLIDENVSSPARLLRARSCVLPFTAREGVLEQLCDWVFEPGAFSMCLVGGRGGSGKTRLGVEVARHAGRAGWLSGMLVAGASGGAVEALIDVQTPCLVVVDYAETRAEQLEVLLPLLAAHATAVCPVRVLLLVRAAPRRGSDWTQVLRHRSDALDVLLDDVRQLLLENAPLVAAEREALFGVAAAAFAERVDGPAGSAPPTPQDIGEPAFASPLMVVIAAYLAVHSDAGDVPATRGELLDELLAHEQRYWAATAKAARLDCDAVLRKRVVALMTLTGASGEREGAELLALLDDLRDASAKVRGEIARWAHELYPAGDHYWNALEPDLAGERLVATTFTAEAGTGSADVLSRVLARPDAHALVQPLRVLARAAPDQPELAQQLQMTLSDRLPKLCELAIAQAASETNLELLLGDSTLAAALHRAVSTVAVNVAALPGVVGAFPRRADLVLNPLVLVLTAQQTTHARQLAQTDPETHNPTLAQCLNNLSVRLADAGRRVEALAAIEEAVKVYRRLAEANAAAYEPDLASVAEQPVEPVGGGGASR